MVAAGAAAPAAVCSECRSIHGTPIVGCSSHAFAAPPRDGGGPPPPALHAADSPTGRQFVSGGYDKTLRIWSCGADKSEQVYHTKRMQRLFSVCWSMDAAYVLSGARAPHALSNQNLDIEPGPARAPD